jgi:hypothetical protein
MLFPFKDIDEPKRVVRSRIKSMVLKEIPHEVKISTNVDK